MSSRLPNALFILLTVTCSVQARVPLGEVVETFPYIPSKVLADPIRPRVYVADTKTNSVVVINTESLKVLASIPSGSGPVDLAISGDDSTLYVANAGSSLTAVGVIDLRSLTLRTSFALPGPVKAIAAGPAGRLYAAAVLGNDQSEVCQLDGTSGIVETTFNSGDYVNDFLQISPDGSTLFSADEGIDPSTIMSFDLSTAPPSLLQSNTEAGENSNQLALSHGGKYLCLTCGGGNSLSGGYVTDLFAATNINATYGELTNGDYPGPLAFSPNDRLVYQTIGDGEGTNTLQVFNTATFVKTAETTFPAAGSDYGDTITSIVADHTDSYLFVGESAMEADSQGMFYQVGQMLVIGTGNGPLSPRPPRVNVAATVSLAVFGKPDPGKFTLTLSQPALEDLKVNYWLTGTAVDGTDYDEIGRTADIQAGNRTGLLEIVPEGAGHAASPRTVKLTVLPGRGYVVGSHLHAKITIVEDRGGSQ